jgi:hypothetical protein
MKAGAPHGSPAFVVSQEGIRNMARIQNKNLPWTQLRLRSGRVVQTDGDGVIDNLSDEEANALGSTPGWRPAGSIGAVTTKAAPAPVPAPPAPVPAPVAESAEEVGPDIDGLKSKADALALAKAHGVEITESMKLAEMKAALNKAIYGD